MKSQEKPGLTLRGLCRAIPVMVVLVLMFCQVASAGIDTFASGMYTPESISVAPNDFGDYGGDYFIPDAGRITIPDSGSLWVVDKTTGSASQIASGTASGLPNHPLGGLFLPGGWGTESGKFLVSGYTEAVNPDLEDTTDPNRYQHGYLTTFDSKGKATTILSYLHEDGSSTLCDPIIAPDGFGNDLDGALIITDQQGNLMWVKPNETLTGYVTGELVDFVNTLQNGFNPFGITLASDGFGNVGGTLLVSESSVDKLHPEGPRIVSVDSSGNVTDFSTIPLFYQKDTRLRQMVMSSEDFLLSSLGIKGKVLLVSVTASQYGGGLGTLLALDSDGTIVAHLKVGTALEKFDPRGILVLGDGSLMISDASDPIILAHAENFALGAPATVPEPCSMIAIGVGCVGLLLKRRKSSK